MWSNRVDPRRSSIDESGGCSHHKARRRAGWSGGGFSLAARQRLFEPIPMGVHCIELVCRKLLVLVAEIDGTTSTVNRLQNKIQCSTYELVLREGHPRSILPRSPFFLSEGFTNPDP